MLVHTVVVCLVMFTCSSITAQALDKTLAVDIDDVIEITSAQIKTAKNYAAKKLQMKIKQEGKDFQLEQDLAQQIVEGCKQFSKNAKIGVNLGPVGKVSVAEVSFCLLQPDANTLRLCFWIFFLPSFW